MNHSYDEQYLYDAQTNLGEAFDYAILGCNIDGDRFLELFIKSGLAGEFGSGSPRLVSGLSGTELALKILENSLPEPVPPARNYYDFSPEYWTGWILAYYQWYTGQSFENIHKYISIKDIIRMYNPLHEAPVEKFVEIVLNKSQDKKIL